jgi:hypothetical protein
MGVLSTWGLNCGFPSWRYVCFVEGLYDGTVA